MKFLFEWTPKISVGDETIDKQHQKLLGQVNTLLSAVVSGLNDQTTLEAVAFLDTYITDHLLYEEKYMKEHNFPDIENHIKMHRDFIEHYKIFKDNLTKGVSKEILALDIEQYIGNWWIEHIGIADKQYALFIQGQK